MTKEEFDSIVSEQKEKGMSEEDIVKAFAVMFKEGVVDRDQFVALIGGLGYELKGELAEASDEELKEKILVDEGEAVSKEEAKEGDEDGEPAPAAPKASEKEDKEEEKEEVEEESETESMSEEDEREEALKRFGLR